MPVGEGIEGRVDKVGVRLGVLELLELGHTLVIVEPGRLHLLDRPGLQDVELPAQDGHGILEDALDEREQIELIAIRPQS